MALFPSYGSTGETESKPNELLVWKDKDLPSEAVEFQLLASDTEESEPGKDSKQNKEIWRNPTSQINITSEFYLDSKYDYGNLGVSTLYYPGRPEYHCKKGDYAVGAKFICKEKRVQRYFSRCIPENSDGPAITERAEAYQLLLTDNPDDITLWEKFIDFQERCGSAEAALAAAERAVERHPHAARLRVRLLECVRAALPPLEQLRRLRALLAAERDPRARLLLWERLLAAAATQPASTDTLAATVTAATADTRAVPASYPRLLYAAGVQLRAAGLWERLVLLVELAARMNLCVDVAPRARSERQEHRLAGLEDEVTASGLPLSAVWVRVERARAGAHWRVATGDPSADPQRQPRAHDVADLLQPVAPPHLLHLAVRLLLLAKVPLVPGTEWAARAFGGEQADCAEALLPLAWAARELPAAHPARGPSVAARRLLALALDPPHYFSDEWGYLSWVEALWDACCGAAGGAAREALLGWRVRWLRAQLLLTEADASGRAERERVHAAARGALRALRCAEPTVVAELARLELLAVGPERAASTAALALRSALSGGPPEHALYVARVLGEVNPGAGPGALVSAVLGRTCSGEPVPEVRAAALRRCEERCEELERELGTDEGTVDNACAALLPSAGEWARARAALAPPVRRRRLLNELVVRASEAEGAARRYYEEGGEALVRAAAAEGEVAAAARLLAPLFPHNAYLALACAGAPLWAWRTQSADERMRSLSARAHSDVCELAGALPSLLRALGGDEPFSDAAASEAAARALRRATAGARGARAGALLWTLRLEVEARAPRPRLPHALYAALDAAPEQKWLYVRGAAWCGGEAEALEDALLERQLRLHALRDELRPQRDAPQPDDSTG